MSKQWALLVPNGKKRTCFEEPAPMGQAHYLTVSETELSTGRASLRSASYGHGHHVASTWTTGQRSQPHCKAGLGMPPQCGPATQVYPSVLAAQPGHTQGKRGTLQYPEVTEMVSTPCLPLTVTVTITLLTLSIDGPSVTICSEFSKCQW